MFRRNFLSGIATAATGLLYTKAKPAAPSETDEALKLLYGDHPAIALAALTVIEKKVNEWLAVNVDKGSLLRHGEWTFRFFTDPNSDILTGCWKSQVEKLAPCDRPGCTCPGKIDIEYKFCSKRIILHPTRTDVADLEWGLHDTVYVFGTNRTFNDLIRF